MAAASQDSKWLNRRGKQMLNAKNFTLAVYYLALMLVGSNAGARDSDFPSRVIRIIVPYPPGAATDAISRAVAAEAGKALGTAIIIVNRPGGGTAIGTRVAKDAPADGYTLLFQSSVLASNLYALNQPGYSLSDFTAVAMLSNTSYVLLTPANLPVKDLTQFIAYAKANPGKVNYGSLGPTSRQRALAERLAKRAGFAWTEVPFKGTAESAQAVMGGEIQGYFSTQSFALTQAHSPALRMLGIASDQRSNFLPNVPTFKEQGYPELSEQSWYALFARSETPKPIIDKLKAVFAQVTHSPAIEAQLKNDGLSPYLGKIEDFPAQLAQESRQLGAEMKALGVTPQ
jgi:tripartite-type tricarboxylate transporter receptor subunit TctC